MRFDVAHAAVLICRASEIVEGRGHAADGVRLGRGEPHVGVTLQAHEPLLMAGEHARIRRAVRLVARFAAFHFHRRMLKSKRPALVAVAADATGLVGVFRVDHAREKTAVGVMTIDAGHGAFRQAMRVRPLKLGPNLDVAAGAFRVDRLVAARGNRLGIRLVHRMAANAGDLMAAVPALNPAGMGECVLVAAEANALRFRRLDLGRIHDVGGGRGLGVLASRTVAGLARPPSPLQTRAANAPGGFHRMMAVAC